MEVIRGAHRIGYRAVAFDVLPRFRQSKFCEELCALHLSRQLSNVARRALLDPHLDARAQPLGGACCSGGLARRGRGRLGA